MKQIPETEGSFVHSVLGILRRIAPQTWWTEPLSIGQFPLKSKVIVAGGFEVPDNRLLDEAVAIVESNHVFKALVEQKMYQTYREDIFPCYDDLPSLPGPSSIWRLISEFAHVRFSYEPLNPPSFRTQLCFYTVFDGEHDFVVRFRNRELYEVMMDG